MKVLVAEDTKSNLMFLKACIEKAGFDVITASDGIEAIEQFDKHNPDLILLDVIMPGLDGIEAAKKIRERTVANKGHWVPIIFISAMDSDHDVVRGLEIGGDDYICKPVSQAVLNAKLHAMRRIYEIQRELDAANKQLKLFAEYDVLTGLANRRKFNDQLEREWKRSARTAKPLCLCICDVDYFKQYNDHYGHQGGDDALCAIADSLFKTIRRPGDLVTRYGGEEFAIIMPETDINGAMIIIEKARIHIEELNILHAGSAISKFLTVSAGISSALPRRDDHDQGIKTMIRQADEALYTAKAQGRNSVVIEATSLEVTAG